MVKRTQTEDAQQWITDLSSLREKKDIAFLQSAIDLYKTKDSLQLKKGLGIANVLLLLNLDSATLAAAIVFPGMHEHEIHVDHIIECLGEDGRKLIHDAIQMQSLGKLHQLDLRNNHQVENLRKMLLAMVTDARAVLITLAERLWYLHQIKKIEPSEQIKIAQETLDVFAPLANRLGIWQLKWEIEDLCLRYLQPEVYTKVAKWLSSRRQEREEYIQRVITIVDEMLSKANIQNFQVTGRVKHIYSIYRKMVRKSAGIEKIYDVSAIRILVSDVGDCYAVLSLLQDKWDSVPEEFDDYISQPKSNGYRSIHTVVIGPENHFVEVQIRTYQMHQEAESGISAHWQYKEGALQPANYEEKIALLRQIIDWQREIVNPEAKADKKMQDLFADRVYVFTPTGDIVDLPQGATPLDFAYHIHSEVGHRCRGAKINGNIVPLTYTLQTGERVEILTAKQANPSRDWLNPHLNYLKTTRARTKVTHWFRMQESAQNIITGRELFEKELKKIGYSEKPDLHMLATKFNFKSPDDLFTALAIGELRIIQIIHLLRPTAPQPLPPPTPLRPVTRDTTSHVQILGVNNLLTQMAHCCKPLPGDPIIGYITRMRGVSIHRRDCKNILHIHDENNERFVEVNWGEKTAGKYSVDLLLHVHNRSGLIRDLTTMLSSEKIHLLGLQTQTSLPVAEADIVLTIEISSREQLQKAIELLQKIPGIIAINRR